MDKLTAMATFVAVNDAGSFTAAAEVLAVPKARVSQRISALEAALGVRLINRTTRSLALTTDGASYLERCRAVIQDIDDIEGTLRGGVLDPSGKLRIEALVSVARWILAPHLEDFRRRYPKIELRVTSSDRLSHLLEDGIDCAIRGGHLEDSAVVARKVCDVHVGLYASPDYLEIAHAPTEPSELAMHRHISWFPASPFHWRLQSGVDSATFKGTSGLQFNDPDVAMEACLAGAGICPGAPFAVEHLVRTGRLAPVLPAWSFAPRPISLVYPGNRHLSKRVRCFVDWFLDLVEANPNIALTPHALASIAVGAHAR